MGSLIHVVPRAEPPTSAPPLPALLEALDRDGAVRQSWRIERWPVTVGRGLDNDVVLTDPHVAARHAVLDLAEPADGRPATLTVTAGETRNGVRVGARERIGAGEARTLVDDGRDVDLLVGRTPLRLRLPGHPLAPEQLLAPVAGAGGLRWPTTAGLALAVLAGVAFATWIDTDPDNVARNVSAILLSTAALTAIWCGAWALVSKLFARQGHLGWHVRVAVVASLAMLALSVLPALAAFSFSWPWITDFAYVPGFAVAAAALYFHLLAVEPGRRRLLRGIAAAGFLAGVVLTTWFNVQRTGRPGEELYMSHLFPPALRVAKGKPAERIVQGMAPMQATLDKRARETGPDGDGGFGGDDSD